MPACKALKPHNPLHRGLPCADLELILRSHGIKNLIFTGVCTDVCVHSSLRDAGDDRGSEGLLVTDATGATSPANHRAAVHMVQTEVPSPMAIP